MAEAFAERMKYLLGEMKVAEAIIKIIEKAEVTLDKIRSTQGDDKMRRVEDKQGVVLWAKELEDATYELEDALYKWRLNSVKAHARLFQIYSRGMLALLAQCCIPFFRWIRERLEAWKGLAGLAVCTESQVETLFLKGNKLLKLQGKKECDEETLFLKGNKLLKLLGKKECDEDHGQEMLCSDVREEDENCVLNHLLSTEHGVKVISIAGNTTLAKSLYNHYSVKQHFKVRAWIHASNISDDRTLAKKLLESLQIEYPEEDSKVESLLQLLQDLFSGKTVLVVFDDVLGEQGFKLLEPFKKLFENSKVGSRFLVTTEDERAGEASGSIVHTLGMVRFPKFCESYDTLLPHMKACLLGCANFPKGTVIDSDKLVKLWMSQGYLGYPAAVLLNDSSNEHTEFEPYHDVERKGVDCLSRLVDHSLFERIAASQPVHKPSSDLSLKCKMPDDAHDFLTYMAQGRDHAVRKCRFYIFPQVHCVSRDFGQLKRMTALDLSSCHLDELPDEVSLLTRLQYLDLSDNPLKVLPSAICKLYYLEFLDLHFCYLLSLLPYHIGDLTQMRHLRINHTTEELHDLPPGFEKLNLLRTLDVFRVGGRYKDSVKKLKDLNHLVDICIAVHGVEDDFSLAKLESKDHMVNLELCFVGEGRKQEVVSSIEDMIPPPSLEMLKFDHYPGLTLPKWILDESVIEKLKRLSLRSAANITSFPDLWKLTSLEFLWLYGLPNVTRLGREFFGPTNTLQHLFSESTHEEITAEAPGNLLETERVIAFRSLKTLRIEHLENWETWEDTDEAHKFNIKVMPCLEDLITADCPKLQGRPLCILRDTPWFKKNMGEAHEKNVKRPSKGANAALRASYIKLKKFVRDAYMARVPAQPLKVSIPEGVLGKTRETTYLQIDYLLDWFEKDRSIFAEQMCVWSKHVYELMKTSDKERVQIVSSGLIKKVGRQEHSDERAEDLVDFMMENKAKIYLVPFLSPGHWELLAIIPESDVVYWFDSLQGSISPELTEFLNMVERKYVTGNLNSTLAHDISWKVVDIKHKRQVDNWQCGYYVMIWMQKIALEIPDLNLEAHFPTDESPYEPDKLREVDWKWCAQVMLEIAA